MTTYHPQTNGKTKMYNKTTVTKISHLEADLQTDWDTYVKPLTYAYNTQPHRSENVSKFSLVLSRQQFRKTKMEYRHALPGDVTVYFPADQMIITLLRILSSITNYVEKNLTKSQKSYQRYFEKSVKYIQKVRPGSEVYLNKAPQSAKTNSEIISGEP